MRPAWTTMSLMFLLGMSCQLKGARPSCTEIYRETLTALAEQGDLDAAVRDECAGILSERSVLTELLDREAIIGDAQRMKKWEYRIIAGSVEALSALEYCYRSVNKLEASAGVHITVYMNSGREVVLVTSSAVFF
jgi:hypothetical protein